MDDFKKYLKEQKQFIQEATKLTTDSNIKPEDRVLNLLIIEKYNLQKQIEQLENKKDSVSKDKYNSLKADFEELRKNKIKTNEHLEAVKNDYRNLAEELDLAKEKLLEMETLKSKKVSNKNIKTYQNKIDTLTKKYEELECKYNTLKLETRANIKSKSGRKRKSDISDDYIINMSKEGKSLRTISKETGLSINTIRDILKDVSK